MATGRRFSASAVIDYFGSNADDSQEVFFAGSDDDLGFEDSDDELQESQLASASEHSGDSAKTRQNYTSRMHSVDEEQLPMEIDQPVAAVDSPEEGKIT